MKKDVELSRYESDEEAEEDPAEADLVSAAACPLLCTPRDDPDLESNPDVIRMESMEARSA